MGKKPVAHSLLTAGTCVALAGLVGCCSSPQQRKYDTKPTFPSASGSSSTSTPATPGTPVSTAPGSAQQWNNAPLATTGAQPTSSLPVSSTQALNTQGKIGDGTNGSGGFATTPAPSSTPAPSPLERDTYTVPGAPSRSPGYGQDPLPTPPSRQTSQFPPQEMSQPRVGVDEVLPRRAPPPDLERKPPDPSAGLKPMDDSSLAASRQAALPTLPNLRLSSDQPASRFGAPSDSGPTPMPLNDPAPPVRPVPPPQQ
jgi:hypothetical protein